MSWFTLVLVIAALALVYVQARASWWLAVMIAWVAAAHASGAAGPLATTVLAIVFVLPQGIVPALERWWASWTGSARQPASAMVGGNSKSRDGQ